jgi:cell division protein FtsN
MAKTKKYEITLDRKQAFFTIIGLVTSFFLTFALGVVIGTKSTSIKNLIQNEKVEPFPQELPPLESFKTTQTKGEGEGEEEKNITQFTFYDTLPKRTEVPLTEKKKEVKAKDKKKVSVAKKSARKTKTLDQDMLRTRFTIQLGSFKEKEKAYALQNKLKKQGYLIRVTPKKIEDKGTYYRVRMGNFNTPEEAQEWVSKLRGLSPPPFITSTPD